MYQVNVYVNDRMTDVAGVFENFEDAVGVGEEHIKWVYQHVPGVENAHFEIIKLTPGMRLVTRFDADYSGYDPYGNYPQGVIVGANPDNVMHHPTGDLTITIGTTQYNVHNMPRGAYGVRYIVGPSQRHDMRNPRDQY